LEFSITRKQVQDKEEKVEGGKQYDSDAETLDARYKDELSREQEE
jgi:hypothetical protein